MLCFKLNGRKLRSARYARTSISDKRNLQSRRSRFAPGIQLGLPIDQVTTRGYENRVVKFAWEKGKRRRRVVGERSIPVGILSQVTTNCYTLHIPPHIRFHNHRNETVSHGFAGYFRLRCVPFLAFSSGGCFRRIAHTVSSIALIFDVGRPHRIRRIHRRDRSDNDSPAFAEKRSMRRRT